MSFIEFLTHESRLLATFFEHTRGSVNCLQIILRADAALYPVLVSRNIVNIYVLNINDLFNFTQSLCIVGLTLKR